ncbi:hypothetical protein F4780DRAFT_506071 [Xylariomycetidae sp. FL0641]|nr:hypothetical protein F4780DRAFT_506071 [Xylariomycetidae sp. FL0641]
MSKTEPDPDIRSIVDAAAASWYSQRSRSPNRDRPSAPRNDSPNAPSQAVDETAVDIVNIASDITAWESALLVLPEEFKNSRLPIHSLSQALAEQPTLRPVEWNQHRQQGGFVPRTAHDYSSLMIYISGQVNPNPCRNCLLKNGPFARCIVSPPTVLAISSLRHACANCTYQNQYKKCTNAPITQGEMVRSQWSRTPAMAKPATPKAPAVKKSQPASQPKASKRDFKHMVQKPTSQAISADSFAEKLRQARSWSPRSRRRMKAEVAQWKAAIATVEAEKCRTFPDRFRAYEVPGLPANVLPPAQSSTQRQNLPPSTCTHPSSAEASPAYPGAFGYGADGGHDHMDEDETEDDGIDETWPGIEDYVPASEAPH